MLSWSNLETSASGRKGGRANALERKEGALIRADGNRDGTAAACADYDIMREVFLPCLADMQMEETCAADVGAPEREGRMFRMPRDVASGYFWLYAERDFAISATDMLFPRDFREQCRHPRFVSVRYYLSGSCVESVTNRTVEAPYLEGHSGHAALGLPVPGRHAHPQRRDHARPAVLRAVFARGVPG